MAPSRHLKLETEYGFEHFVKERDFYPEHQTRPMMLPWPRKAEWTTTPAASRAIRYVLAPLSVTLAVALSRMFVHFRGPQLGVIYSSRRVHSRMRQHPDSAECNRISGLRYKCAPQIF